MRQPQRRQAVEEGVAFMATKSVQQDDVGINQHIIFENVILNTGNGYHERQGLFIAPQSGVYLFSVSLMAAPVASRKELDGAIVRNGNILVRIYGYGDPYDQGAQTIIVFVSAGDEIWVSSIEQISTVYGGLYSSFSGYLLMPV